MIRNNIRLALPSKGRLAEDAFEFLAACGLGVYRPNVRQYIASIPSQPDIEVILQRPGDIVIGVRQGSLDFGITGYDMLAEKNFGHEAKVLILHDQLGFGKCSLHLAAPDQLEDVRTVADLSLLARRMQQRDARPLRIATKFPNLTAAFLDQRDIISYRLIDAEGTLEIAPTIGYADVIVDLVSSGMTLRDNHLHTLEGGEILQSQACLVANREALLTRPTVLTMARTFLEFFEAHQRASDSYMVISNMRGESAESVAERMFAHPQLAGLRGPTIAPVFTRNGDGHSWFSISIVVKRKDLTTTIAALRQSGGSGVIVTPAIYIFEEEPQRYQAMLAALNTQ